MEVKNMVKIEVEVPDEIVKFLDSIKLGVKGYVERNLPGWLACDLDACDDLDVWFDADVKTICKYLVYDSAGNDIVCDRAGLQREKNS
jgi:hypothetical protein